MKRLPLPLSTIKEIKNVLESETSLWIINPLKNCLQDICEYDYKESIDTLNMLKRDYPNLMNYDKHIKNIQKSQERYNQI
jgi:hypothetical protein